MSEMFDSIMDSFDETIKASKEGKLKVKYVFRPVRKYSGDEIRMIRNDLGLTQVVFAYLLGVSKKTVEAWEAGKNKPTGPALRMMELLYNKDISLEMLSR